jgi:predicted dienelactone hydrolase
MSPSAFAIENLVLKLPVIDLAITAKVSELASPDALLAGNSDLAQLDRATDGSYARTIKELLDMRLPKPPDGIANGIPQAAMTQEIEVILKQLIDVDPGKIQLISNDPINAGLKIAIARGGPLTLLSLLQSIPGQSLTIRLDRAMPFIRRKARDEQEIDQLIEKLAKLPSAPANQLRPGPQAIQTNVAKIPVSGTNEILEVTVVRPQGTPSLPAVVISHGLWDSPESFLGWAQHLASHGAPVFLPRHPGSDSNQQAAMLAGQAPPPDPKEFLRRPNDVRAVLDALDAGAIPVAKGITSRQASFIGHSWGGTTALQLAGARSLPAKIWQACGTVNNPNSNISWVLQCTFLKAATDSSMADDRIARLVAVSPPQGLVFAAGFSDLSIPLMLVSGSRDWVVPTRPEALVPYGNYPKGDNPLVLVEGGTHFNLPAKSSSNGGPLRALLLSWVQGKGVDKSAAVADPQGLGLRLMAKP